MFVTHFKLCCIRYVCNAIILKLPRLFTLIGLSMFNAFEMYDFLKFNYDHW